MALLVPTVAEAGVVSPLTASVKMSPEFTGAVSVANRVVIRPDVLESARIVRLADGAKDDDDDATVIWFPTRNARAMCVERYVRTSLMPWLPVSRIDALSVLHVSPATAGPTSV